MPKSKQEKKQILKNLIDKISRAKAIIFAGFDALTVKDNERLRDSLKEENSEYYVVKKTLLDLAFKQKHIANLNIKDFQGKIAVVFGYADEVASARLIDKFNQDREIKINFIGGILENKFIDAAAVDNLAKLPAKEELYAKIVGSINAPVFGFVNVLAGNLRSLVYVLKAIESRK